MKTELERAVGEVLIDPDTLRARVAELGDELSAYYEGRDLLLIGVLRPTRPASSGSSRTSTSTSKAGTCSSSRTSSIPA
jgi:hypothetical protein